VASSLSLLGIVLRKMKISTTEISKIKKKKTEIILKYFDR